VLSGTCSQQASIGVFTRSTNVCLFQLRHANVKGVITMELKAVSWDERSMGGMDYFILWFGAAISIAEIYAGNILVPLGWGMGLAAIIAGHLIGNIPLALGGRLGSDQGLPTMYVLRPTFGRRGSYLATVLNIMQLVGWTAVMLIICGEAVGKLPHTGGSQVVKIWIIAAGVICTVWAVLGKATFKWLQRLAVTTLGVLCVIMTVMLWIKYRESGFSTASSAGGFSFGIGLDLSIALPISWLPLVADYSRFARTHGGSFWGTYVGYFLGGCWMFALGLGSGLVLNEPDPISTVAVLGLGIPALVIILFSTFTTTFLDIYSTAVSALNLRPQTGEKWLIIPAGALGIIVALIFPMTEYENFLLLIGSFFVPLFGIVLTDYFLMDYKERKARSVEWTALAAWVAGVVIFQITSRHFYLGGSLPTFIVSGLIYWILRKVFPDVRQ